MRKAKQVNLETVIEGFDSGGIDRKLEQLNIWEAINSLEEIEKEIIILRYYQDSESRIFPRLWVFQPPQ